MCVCTSKLKSDGLLTAKHFDDAMKNARRSVSKVMSRP